MSNVTTTRRVAVLLGVLVLALALLWGVRPQRETGDFPVQLAEGAGGEQAEARPETAGPPEPVIRTATVQRGDSCLKIFKDSGIDDQQAHELIQAARGVFDLAKIRPGHDFILAFDPATQELVGVRYEITNLSELVLSVTDDGLAVEKRKVERILAADYAGALQPEDVTVKDGDRVYDILHRLGVCDYQIDCLVRAARKTFDLKEIIPGQVMQVWVTAEKPVRVARLSYGIDDFTFLELTPRDGRFVADMRRLVCDVRYERAAGKIESSLYESGIDAGLAPEIVMALTDIFAWDINFFTEIRPGDAYTVLYEKKYLADTFKGYGRVVAAKFTNQGRDHTALYFDDGKGSRGYYDESGKPIRKLFLKAPLKYRRISSGFSYHRMHPVFHVVKPHLGVDYAAPTGTPVVALGDGKIEYKGWTNGYGHNIRIKHRAGYVTYYGHFSRFARGMKRGVRVEQGQVIGYVGATGIATGPHLDFRVRYKGKFINPLRLKPVAGPRLSGDSLAQFRQIIADRLAQLDDPALNIALNLSNNNSSNNN